MLQGALGLIILTSAIILLNERIGNVKEAPAITAVEAAQTAVKINIERPGMYKITSDALKKLGLASWLKNPEDLKLYLRGVEQPFWVEGQGDSAVLLFYGTASESVYSSENVYWLTYGSSLARKLAWGERSASENGVPAGNSIRSENKLPLIEDGCYETKHFEENKLYAPLVEAGDHWFWDKVISKQKKSYSVSIGQITSGGGILRIDIWSPTQANSSPDHHITVALNGRMLMDEAWDGAGTKYLEGEIPDGVLKEGENQITISVVGVEGVMAEIDHLDWIEIEYPRKLIADHDYIEFEALQNPIKISGLTKDVSVYDISDISHIQQIIKHEQVSNGSFEFETQIGKRYLVVGEQGYLTPKKLETAKLDIDLRSDAVSAEWIAVGPADLLKPMTPLLNWREKNGLSTRAIPVEFIYDQFGYGFPEPEAIRQFITYILSHSQPATKYLVLVGDASYDPRAYLGNLHANRLPTFLIQTSGSGETASDVKFIELDNDSKEHSLADIAIGRIPAQTEEQVANIVDKIITYENKTLADGNGSVLAVADGQEASFAEEARSFLAIFEDKYHTKLLAPEAGATDAAQQIVDSIKQSGFLVAYFGHGSLNMWGKDMLFTADNVKDLSNLQRYPIVLNFTCLTGFFIHPVQESLAETLLWRADGGAVAVLAPTSLTLASDQSFLIQPLAIAIAQNSQASIGSLLQKIRLEMSTHSEGVKEVMETFLLFGDPATRLMQP